MTDERACARCGAALAHRQEYCLECGERAGPPRRRPLHWLWPAALSALVAAGGTAAAIAAGGDDPEQRTIVALSTLRPIPGRIAGGTAVAPGRILDWPQRDGYTVVVAAIPQAAGREAATVRAREAIAAGLPEVGILDSARFASLHPGYLLVFSGVYATRDEALLALPRAARRFRGAYAQELVR